jgi:hypothetical protein
MIARFSAAPFISRITYSRRPERNQVRLFSIVSLKVTFCVLYQLLSNNSNLRLFPANCKTLHTKQDGDIKVRNILSLVSILSWVT